MCDLFRRAPEKSFQDFLPQNSTSIRPNWVTLQLNDLFSDLPFAGDSLSPNKFPIALRIRGIFIGKYIQEGIAEKVVDIEDVKLFLNNVYINYFFLI